MTSNGSRTVPKDIPLRLIPEPLPGTRTIFVTDSRDLEFVFMVGTGGPSYCCGACSRRLIADGENIHLEYIVFRCPSCSMFNEANT